MQVITTPFPSPSSPLHWWWQFKYHLSLPNAFFIYIFYLAIRYARFCTFHVIFSRSVKIACFPDKLWGLLLVEPLSALCVFKLQCVRPLVFPSAANYMLGLCKQCWEYLWPTSQIKKAKEIKKNHLKLIWEWGWNPWYEEYNLRSLCCISSQRRVLNYHLVCAVCICDFTSDQT